MMIMVTMMMMIPILQMKTRDTEKLSNFPRAPSYQIESAFSPRQTDSKICVHNHYTAMFLKINDFVQGLLDNYQRYSGRFSVILFFFFSDGRSVRDFHECKKWLAFSKFILSIASNCNVKNKGLWKHRLKLNSFSCNYWLIESWFP